MSARNIAYDVKALESRKSGCRTPPQDAGTVLTRRLGVCTGFASLFVAMCSAVGIEAVMVLGACKGASYVRRQGWQLIQISVSDVI